MIDHWIVEADALDLIYHTLAEDPDQAITHWFADLQKEEIDISGGLIISDGDDTEEHLRSIAFEALRRKLISNSSFYKVVNDRGIDIDSATCDLLRANKGEPGIFRMTDKGYFRKTAERQQQEFEGFDDDDDEWNNWTI
jgi:hypothetical protein